MGGTNWVCYASCDLGLACRQLLPSMRSSARRRFPASLSRIVLSDAGNSGGGGGDVAIKFDGGGRGGRCICLMSSFHSPPACFISLEPPPAPACCPRSQGRALPHHPQSSGTRPAAPAAPAPPEAQQRLRLHRQRPPQPPQPLPHAAARTPAHTLQPAAVEAQIARAPRALAPLADAARARRLQSPHALRRGQAQAQASLAAAASARSASADAPPPVRANCAPRAAAAPALHSAA